MCPPKAGRVLDPESKRLDRDGMPAKSSVRSVRRRGGHSDQGKPRSPRSSWSRWVPRPCRSVAAGHWRSGPTVLCSWLIRLPSARTWLRPARCWRSLGTRGSRPHPFGQQTSDGAGAVLWAAVAELLTPARISQTTKLELQITRCVRSGRPSSATTSSEAPLPAIVAVTDASTSCATRHEGQDGCEEKAARRCSRFIGSRPRSQPPRETPASKTEVLRITGSTRPAPTPSRSRSTREWPGDRGLFVTKQLV